MIFVETNLSSFIWSVADLLLGDYKQSEYGKIILPFTDDRPALRAALKELAADVAQSLETHGVGVSTLVSPHRHQLLLPI